MKNMKHDKIVLDTNILLYASDTKSPFWKQSKQVIEQGIEEGVQFYLPDKVLYEFFAVLSSKAYSKMITHSQAVELLGFYLLSDQFIKISSTEYTLFLTYELIQKYGTNGKRVFDLAIVSIANEHEIPVIYTKNTKDFKGIEEVRAVDPTEG
jgi:predicted nucleic acid-binding protein